MVLELLLVPPAVMESPVVGAAFVEYSRNKKRRMALMREGVSEQAWLWPAAIRHGAAILDRAKSPRVNGGAAVCSGLLFKFAITFTFLNHFLGSDSTNFGVFSPFLAQSCPSQYGGVQQPSSVFHPCAS